MLNIGDEILPYEDWYEPTLQGVKVNGESGQNVEEDKEKINQFALDRPFKFRLYTSCYYGHWT